MDLITQLPSPPLTLVRSLDGQLVLAFADGLALLRGGALEFLDHGPVDGAALGPDGAIYCTRGARILRFEVAPGSAPRDVTASFAGTPEGQRQVTCTPDGALWVEGCASHRRLDGTFCSSPSIAEGPAPVPLALDVYGNQWSLADSTPGQRVLVLPANAPDVWQSAWLPDGPWEHLLADAVGYVWVIGPHSRRRFCPRHMEVGWENVAADLPASEMQRGACPAPGETPAAVTAAGYSPDELAAVGCASGELLELDTAVDGSLVVRSLAVLPGPVRCLHTDPSGAIWAATDDGLYRREPDDDAWQNHWQRQPGRLPGGGNHDIFSAVCGDRLYVAGGWAGQWGLPPAAHVLDELFAHDPSLGYWDVVSRLREPRRYSGIAEMDGQVWVVGGETRTPGWEGEGQVLYTVDIYDPASDTWSPGPSLNTARTDPFVLSCGGRIYALGGAAHNGGPKLDSVESIGPGDDGWRPETPLPAPTRQGHACALDGVIYCASIDGVFAFDTAAGRWDEGLPQPGDIGQAPLTAAYRGEVWLMGGFKDRRTRCYNPDTRAWRAGPDLPVGLAWGAAAVMNGELILVGGAHWSERHQTVVFDDRTYTLR